MEPTTQQQQQQSFRPRGPKTKYVDSIYTRSLVSKSVSVPIKDIGANIEKILEAHIVNFCEGKCIPEGHVKPGSIKIVTYSCGLIKGGYASFEVVFECAACFPVEGMHIYCLAKNITKAGIRAESSTDTPSPFVAFIARDHHYNNPKFAAIKEGDKFIASVIGQRFELNDKHISIIAELKDIRYVEPVFNNRPYRCETDSNPRQRKEEYQNQNAVQEQEAEEEAVTGPLANVETKEEPIIMDPDIRLMVATFLGIGRDDVTEEQYRTNENYVRALRQEDINRQKDEDAKNEIKPLDYGALPPPKRKPRKIIQAGDEV